MLKQPHPELGSQHPQHRPVQKFLIRLTLFKQFQEAFSKARRIRQLHVHAREQRRKARLLQRLTHTLVIVSVSHCSVIADTQALKAHVAAQKIREQMAGQGNHLTVDDAVAGHNSFQLRPTDGRLEGFPVNFLQKTFRRVAVSPVNTTGGIVESQEMLRHRLGAPAGIFALLNTSGVGHSQSGSQGRILPVGFSLTPHAGVPGNIQHRSENMGDSAGRLLAADNSADLLLQLWIPACPPADARGKTDGILDEGSAETFHMENGGDMMGTVLHHQLLHIRLPVHYLIQRLHPPHLQRTDLPDTAGRAF